VNQAPPSSDPDSPKPTGDEPVKPGDILSNKFRVERVLGIGGMGVVVAATHLQLGQLVALKFMLPIALSYPDNIARFEREARAAVNLRSDHVAKITDVGRLDDGAPYMVMEFLEGQDLHQLMRRTGRLPITQAVDFLLQACEAIAEAHSKGIIHRDLKPKNLFLTTRLNGEPLVKVLDFGVSKVLGNEDLSLTSTTQILGSPSYMSPEQLRASRDVDQRTDIWALGAILYELLTRALPFPANTLTQLTAKVITEPPVPIETLRDEIPEELRRVIMKCLEKRADDRFQSVPDFAAALSPFASAASVALATQRMSGNAALASSSSSHMAPPARVSVRPSGDTGGSTDVAWDRTQLAQAGPRRSRLLVVGVAVLALAASAMAVIAVVQLRGGGAGGANGSPTSAGSATASHAATATPPSSGAEAFPLPTVRDPISPPVVSGVERPPPSSLVPNVTAPPTHHPGGHHGVPSALPTHNTVAPTGTGTGGNDLPNTRN
jgi:serine/threonine protein kinase